MTDEQYCGRHRREEYKKYSRFKRDEFSKRFYNSPQWQRLRKQKLAINLLCEHCEREGKVTPATVVDHIVPIKEGGAALDINNLQSLRRSCHDSKTAREDGRWGNKKSLVRG
ncbi:HNH endonuclease [Desulfotruncus alcoholivorax]|uniref:HNH endonuclease n=1 Tax=Desulfotruncus alcoholivorax TaxID=265477 RepID=UPI0004263DB5|nr:HNH endonuclease [Desulfotruncus alcoholivorax]